MAPSPSAGEGFAAFWSQALTRAAEVRDPEQLVIWWAPIPGTAQELFFDDDTPDAALLFCGGWGCVAAETRIYDARLKTHVAIETMAAASYAPIVAAWTGTGFVEAQASVPFVKGVAPLYRIQTVSGSSIVVTEDHRFLTPEGWRSLRALRGVWQRARLRICAVDPRQSSVVAGPSVCARDGRHSDRRVQAAVQRLSVLEWHRDTAVSDSDVSRFDSIASIEAVGEHVFYDVHVPQWENYLAEGFVNHNSGKTMTLWGKALKLSAINAPLPLIWVVPQYDHVEHTLLPKLEERDPRSGHSWFLPSDQYRYHQTKHEFYWSGGGPIWFKSAEHAEAIAGPNVASALVDEPALISQKAWRNTTARVRHTTARLRQTCAAGTADDLSWMQDYFFDPERPDRYKRYEMATTDNRELLDFDPTYVQRIMENATEAEIQAFVHGKGVLLEGQPAYPPFLDTLHWTSHVPPPDPDQPLVLTCDFNVAPMCWVIGQRRIGPAGPEPHVLEGITQDVATTDSACDEFLRKFPSWPAGIDVYGDCNGRNRDVRSHKSNYTIVQERLSVAGPVTLRVPKQNPPVQSRLNAVNRLLKNANGVTRLWIRKWDPARTCPTRQLVRSLQRSKMAAGKQDVEKKSGETITHAGDALGYWVYREWPADKPQVAFGSTSLDY